MVTVVFTPSPLPSINIHCSENDSGTKRFWLISGTLQKPQHHLEINLGPIIMSVLGKHFLVQNFPILQRPTQIIHNASQCVTVFLDSRLQSLGCFYFVRVALILWIGQVSSKQFRFLAEFTGLFLKKGLLHCMEFWWPNMRFVH